MIWVPFMLKEDSAIFVVWHSGLTLTQLVTLEFGDKLDRVLGVVTGLVLGRTVEFSKRALGGALLICLLLVHYKMQSAN
jgi:hypothetical protein